MSTAAPTGGVTERSAATAEFLNPVLVATKQTFEMMLDCTPHRTGLVVKENPAPSFHVSATIGITGRAVGTLVLSISESAAIAVLERLTGQAATEINHEVCDAVGELTNMIAGSAKAKLAQLDLSISIPNIISGTDHKVHYPANVTPLCVMFDSDIGEFCVEIGFAM
ncbi:MAG: chemotaxis protein CheX [Planctomycetota bacterium]